MKQEILTEALTDLFGKRLAQATKEVRRHRDIGAAQQVLTSASDVLEVMQEMVGRHF